jgi:predicted GH43/DUF377 family glycosyl hydrolase
MFYKNMSSRVGLRGAMIEKALCAVLGSLADRQMRNVPLTILLASVIIISSFSLPYARAAGHGRMILDVGTQWDQYLSRPSVVHVDSQFMMWYAGDSQSDGRGIENIGLAISQDGTTWTKYVYNPVLTVGSSGTWDSDSVNDPWVIWDGTQYQMWYTGWSGNGQRAQIGYATSPDGTHWVKFGGNPVLPDEQWVSRPTVITGSGQLVMYYAGRTSDTGASTVLIATSRDGISWSKGSSRPTIPVGSWDSGHYVGSVNVVNNTFLMLYWSKTGNDNFKIGYASSADGINWDPNPSNPIIASGSESWDKAGVAWAMMIPVKNYFYVYYVGFDDTKTNTARIGLAIMALTK